MSNKRKAAMAATMLTLIVAPAAAQILLGVIAAASLLGIGGYLGYMLGIQRLDQAEQKIAELESLLTSSNTTNYYNMRFELNNTLILHYSHSMFENDTIQYLTNYAWALAKYEYLNATTAGLSHSEAITKAQLRVEDYYYKLISNIIVESNETVTIFSYTFDQAIIAANGAGLDKPTGYYDNEAPVSWAGVKIYNGGAEIYSVRVSPDTQLVPKSITALDNKVYYYIIPSTMVYSMEGGDWSSPARKDINKIEWSGKTTWSENDLVNKITELDSQYNMIISNLATYLDALQANNITVNESVLIDPYMLATLLNTDLNSTGYYGFAAAELGLMGLPTTGLNKTVKIMINGTPYEGFLFTNWDTVFERNQTYTVSNGTLVYILTDQGLYQIPAGENFTITDLTDRYGNKLQNTTIIRYIDHSGDISKLEQELNGLYELMQEYQEMQALAGGGGGSGIFDWWNGLSDTEKILVVAAGLVVLILLTRRR